MLCRQYYSARDLPPLPGTPKPKRLPIEPGQLNNITSIINTLECTEIKNQLNSAIEEIAVLWTQEHNLLYSSLQKMEQQHSTLQRLMKIQTERYEKAVREMQFYRSKHERISRAFMHLRHQHREDHYKKIRRRGCQSLDDSIIAYDGCPKLSSKSTQEKQDNQCFSLSSNYGSFVFSSNTSINSSYSCESNSRSKSKTLESHKNKNDLVDDDHFDILSILSDDAKQSSPNQPKLNEPADNEIPDQKKVSPSLSDSVCATKLPQSDTLTFACGEGFWESIALRKYTKAEISTLISNYFRRGGLPNVANVYPTVRDVKEGYSLVHALVAVKNTRALEQVLEAGANTNVYPMSSVPEDRISPLVLAASIGYLNGVRLLVERGKADIMQSVGPNQETALHAAIRCDSLDIIIYLLKVSRYALLEKPDEAGSTPLHYACMSGKTRLVTLLIRDCRVDPSPQDIKGETPLHYAVRHQRPKVIARLVGELGVYPNPYILKQVPTPLDLARSGGLKSISSYLKQNGAKTTKEMEKAISGNIISSGSSSSSSSSERSKPNSIKQKILSNKPSLVLKNKFGGLLSGLLS